jgi:hypothetical protein
MENKSDIEMVEDEEKQAAYRVAEQEISLEQRQIESRIMYVTCSLNTC